LVNNAGVVFGGGFLDVPIERHRSTIDINLSGILTVTHTFLPDLLRRPEGYLVNIVSASAMIALPYATSYAASKAAALSFSDSLREELRLTNRRNVRVLAVCPSYISTGLFDGAKAPAMTWILQPDFVARQTVRAVERGRDFLILPWTARLLYSTTGWVPTSVYRRLCAWLGVSTSMVEWRGHAAPKEGPPAAPPSVTHTHSPVIREERRGVWNRRIGTRRARPHKDPVSFRAACPGVERARVTPGQRPCGR
jgi:all-trans-retinol dehydrogenase (NAD+)